MSDAILKILDETMIGEKIGEAALKTVKERFLSEMYMNETQAIYSELLGKA